jgi:hypothetical protein
VVPFRISEDEFAGELADPVEGDPAASEDTGRGEEGLVAKEFVAFAEVGGEVTCLKRHRVHREEGEGRKRRRGKVRTERAEEERNESKTHPP